MEDTVAYFMSCGMTRSELDRLHEEQGLSYEEIRKAAENIIGRGGSLRDEETPDPSKELRPADYSDAGSRDVFCTYYGDKIRWTPGEGWHSYNSKVWQRDEGAVMERVVEFSKAMLAEAKQQHIKAASDLARAQAEDADSITKNKLAKEAQVAKSYLAFAQRQRNLYPLKSVLKLSESRLQMPDSAFDADPNLLCCSNGVLDLNTMELYPHDPGFLISKAIDAEYDPDADTTENEAFLDSIFPDDTQKKPFLKRIFGYSLTGAPIEDKLFIFHGSTSRNGKTTLALSAAATFGDCAVTLPPDSIAASRFADGSRPKPDLVPLRGARLVIVEEPDQELTLDSGLVKRMTGGAEIRARQLRREEIGFTMSGPIILICNNLPYIADRSIFDSNRILVLPFTRHFAEHEIDPTLRDRLRSRKNRSAWLKMALEGLVDYRENGLAPPLCVQTATAEYARSGDEILNFLNACTKPGENTKATDMFAAYIRWTATNNVPALRKGEFLDELRQRHLLAKTATVAGKTEYNVLTGRQLIS